MDALFVGRKNIGMVLQVFALASAAIAPAMAGASQAAAAMNSYLGTCQSDSLRVRLEIEAADTIPLIFYADDFLQDIGLRYARKIPGPSGEPRLGTFGGGRTAKGLPAHRMKKSSKTSTLRAIYLKPGEYFGKSFTLIPSYAGLSCEEILRAASGSDTTIKVSVSAKFVHQEARVGKVDTTQLESDIKRCKSCP